MLIMVLRIFSGGREEILRTMNSLVYRASLPPEKIPPSPLRCNLRAPIVVIGTCLKVLLSSLGGGQYFLY